MTDGAPIRIQLSRKAGWRKPEGAIVVARPGPWGNPHVVSHEHDFWLVTDRIIGFTVGRFATHTEALAFAVDRFEDDLKEGLLAWSLHDMQHALHGRDLCCWCPLDHPCHGDSLLRWANL